MIGKIDAGAIYLSTRNVNKQQKNGHVRKTETLTMPNNATGSLGNYTSTGLVNAYQAYHGIKLAKSVSFGQSLHEVFGKLNNSMTTCGGAEDVGSRISASDLIDSFKDELPYLNDAIKTDIIIDGNKFKPAKDINPSSTKIVTKARTQVKKQEDGIMYEMAVRQPLPMNVPTDITKPLQYSIKIVQEPDAEEKAYVLNTKGKLLSVIEDGDNVILTNAGQITKKADSNGSKLHVSMEETGNVFVPFVPEPQTVQERQKLPSIGEGTDMVIGMEDGRFNPEIIDSILEFKRKIDSEEIILPQFIEKPGAKKTQLVMLAGGFGSRAEYTNASSDGIFHSKEDGAQSTKGVFRTATGLTPMETTFITAHKEGLLDCNNLEIGKNIKLYINRSGVNKGNGGFTRDLYHKMARPGRESITIFPNDSMSRMKTALDTTVDRMAEGKSSIVMIAKEIKSEDAKSNFGIMKLGNNSEIQEFAEKPKVIPDGYEKNGNCLTNTFQFAVSDEAFNALDIIDPVLPAGKGKETRDWSKCYTPILMALSKDKPIEEITDDITKVVKSMEFDRISKEITNNITKSVKDINPEIEIDEISPKIVKSIKDNSLDFDINIETASDEISKVLKEASIELDKEDIAKDISKIVKESEFEIPMEKVAQAKEVLGNQTVSAVPTNEPWADCGTLNALYHTTMQIASGDFKLEDFERKHVLDSINTKTGLVTSNPKQKQEIESKYDVDGEVMVAPKAKKVNPDIVNEFIDKGLVVVNEPETV